MDRDMILYCNTKPKSIFAPLVTTPLFNEIREGYAQGRIVLECPYCHRQKVLQPYYADVAERFILAGKRYIRFMAKCEPCEYLLMSNAHLDVWNETVLKEGQL